MLPHKTARGAAALARLRVYDGCPAPYDTKKRQVVPDALKVIRMQNHRKFTVLGELCAQVGWNSKDIVDRLEEKRRVRARTYYENKLKKGDNLILAAFGGGFTWGSIWVKWAYDPT